ncbi:ABC transporter ATP-binding protein [Legionella cardiaca]|uniref:ABC transporter ATP-binding protein n=1 Tax=Legionella cardiaca TaxID=1071983 RepID=A0ABY8AU01_9GAMM|nr:ABC transporter ATP-binding protein [Legionella cardiaca]WED44048.1 ABC transporter ATP-binding protein [Legionella cardiaca]
MNHLDVIRLNKINFIVKSGSFDLTILQDISFAIKKGATIAITGASGSGKTSLLNIMAGLDIPSSGEVFYGEQEISHLTEDERAKLRARRVGFIFQSFQLLPNLTALENVMLPLEINHYDDAFTQANHWIDKVGLKDRLHHYPLQLSGGEQQRVAIARAFAIEPDILFADEPTGNLDKKTGHTVADLLFDLNTQHKTTLVIVTHDEVLAQRCQLHWRLDDGKLLC